MPLDPYAFQSAFNLQLDRGRQRRADATQAQQLGIQNERQRLQDMYLANQQQRETTVFDQQQQDRTSALEQQRIQQEQQAALRRDESAKRAAGIARNALAITDPVQRKGFLQRAVPAYADDFKVLGIDLNELPAMLTMADQDLAAELQEVAAFGQQQPEGRDNLGSANVGDFEPASYQAWLRSGADPQSRDYSLLKRIWAPQITTVAGAPSTVTRGSGGPAVTQLSTPEAERNAAAAEASAVETAKGTAQAGVERAALAAKNSRAFNTYNVAIGNLQTRMGLTQTDPITGRLPAVTANQQSADAALAAMSPVLKELFRQTGEGVFTDRDQALLLQMIPDRKMLPEARKVAIDNINAIVRSKLGMDAPASAPTQPAGNGGVVDWGSLR